MNASGDLFTVGMDDMDTTAVDNTGRSHEQRNVGNSRVRRFSPVGNTDTDAVVVDDVTGRVD